jgi:hypothetical protein
MLGSHHHGTIFFSHNKLALADLSAIETISRTAPKMHLASTNPLLV